MQAAAHVPRFVKNESCITRFTVLIAGNVATNVVSALELIMNFEENLLEPTIYHVILQSVIYTNANREV